MNKNTMMILALSVAVATVYYYFDKVAVREVKPIKSKFDSVYRDDSEVIYV